MNPVELISGNKTKSCCDSPKNRKKADAHQPPRWTAELRSPLALTKMEMSCKGRREATPPNKITTVNQPRSAFPFHPFVAVLRSIFCAKRGNPVTDGRTRSITCRRLSVAKNTWTPWPLITFSFGLVARLCHFCVRRIVWSTVR